MSKRERDRPSHRYSIGIGLTAALALSVLIQAWAHQNTTAVPRSDLARRVDDPGSSSARLALAEAGSESFQLADVRAAEADAEPATSPAPQTQTTSTPELAPQIDPPPKLAAAAAGSEMALSPVDRGEADVGATVESPEPEGDRASGPLGGTSGSAGRGPIVGRGTGRGIGRGCLPSPFVIRSGGSGTQGEGGCLPGPFVLLGGGSGTQGTGLRLPLPIALPGSGQGVAGSPGSPGSYPEAGGTAIAIPTSVPVDPADWGSYGGRGFQPEAPDLGRTDDYFGSGGLPIGTTGARRELPAAGATVSSFIEETARTFGTRRTSSSQARLTAETREAAQTRASVEMPATARMRATTQDRAAVQARAAAQDRAAAQARAAAQERAAAQARATAQERAAAQARATAQTRAAAQARATAQVRAAAQARTAAQARSRAPTMERTQAARALQSRRSSP